MKELKWYTIIGTLIMFLTAALLPLSIPFFTWLVLILFVIGTYLHFKLGDYTKLTKTIIFIVSITVIPYIVYKIQWKNSVSEGVIYILPDNYIGQFSIVYNVSNGAPVDYFTTNLKFEIPNDGILLTKYNRNFNRGGLMFTGPQTFVFKSEFYKRTKSLVEDRSVHDGVQLSDLVTDTTITFVEQLGYKKFLDENEVEYGGVFFHAFKAGKKRIGWKAIKEYTIIEKIKQLEEDCL